MLIKGLVALEGISYSELAARALNGDQVARERLEKTASKKQRCVYEFASTLVEVSKERGIYYGVIDSIPVIIDLLNDKHYRDGRHKRELKAIDGEIYANDKKYGWVKIFDGKRFDFRLVKFTEGWTTSGSKNYKSIALCTEKYGVEKIRCHWLTAVVKYNMLVLDCIGDSKVRLFDINHIDGNHLNNRMDNLEVITHIANVQHYIKLSYQKLIARCIELGYMLPESVLLQVA
jgi:hypothetical protein